LLANNAYPAIELDENICVGTHRALPFAHNFTLSQSIAFHCTCHNNNFV
jgi:hypothetical protein